jgi:hypothetical protein
MEDFKSLLIGIVGGLIVLLIAKLFRAYQRKSILQDIEILEFEKKHLEDMKRSSVEMNRSSFRALFAVLMFVALANLIPMMFNFSKMIFSLNIPELFSFFLWAFVFALSAKFWRRYDDLKNFKEATQRIDDKLSKLRAKVDGN